MNKLINLPLKNGAVITVNTDSLVGFFNRTIDTHPELSAKDFRIVSNLVFSILEQTHPAHADAGMEMMVGLLGSVEVK